MSDDERRLEVRRLVAATPQRLFAAWTDAEQLAAWWGPEGVRCAEATIDARVGGRYRITNELPDGRRVVIAGEYVEVEPATRLVFTWRLEHGPDHDERVTVLFEPVEDGTEIIVIHERIGDEASRVDHESGWRGCLVGLDDWASTGRA